MSFKKNLELLSSVNVDEKNNINIRFTFSFLRSSSSAFNFCSLVKTFLSQNINKIECLYDEIQENIITGEYTHPVFGLDDLACLFLLNQNKALAQLQKQKKNESEILVAAY